MSVYTKLSTVTNKSDKVLQNLSFEEAFEVISNRIKFPNASEFNVAPFIIDAALLRIVQGEDSASEKTNTKSKTQTNNSKSDKAKSSGKEEDVSE